MPLDGMWLRAPYLHNGSVPTCATCSSRRRRGRSVFYRGNDVYDPVQRRLRARTSRSRAAASYFAFDTTQPGNTNAGHEGKRYGTDLSPQDKDALVEFLKTF